MIRVAFLFIIPVFLLALPSTTGILAGKGVEGVAEADWECEFGKALEDIQAGVKRPRPPNGPKYVYKTHFIIHFDTTGTYPTTRAYAESVGVYAETCWARYPSLGWALPPPDGTNGGDSRYDIYLRDANSCEPENPYTTPYPDGYSSWVQVGRGHSYFVLRKTVTHEFGHSCQMRYSRFEPNWWFYENTSTFMEGTIHSDFNGTAGANQHPNNPLRFPHFSLGDSRMYPYAGALWTQFLDEYYEAYVPSRAVWRIWDICGMHAGNHLFEDIDSSLRLYYHSDIQKALGHYAIWRYFCGARDDSLHYRKGSTYPNSDSSCRILRTHTTYPTGSNQDTLYPCGPGGCNYIHFTSYGYNLVNFFFDGEDGFDWAVYLIGKKYKLSDEYRILLEPTRDTGRISIPGWEYDTIVLIPVVTHWTSSAESLTYSYTVTRSPSLQSPADGIFGKDERIVFPMLNIKPNLYSFSTRIYYSLPKDSRNNLLAIYDASGRLVTSHKPQIKSRCFIWDGNAANGREVKNGIYFCCLTSDNYTIKKRITVLR